MRRANLLFVVGGILAVLAMTPMLPTSAVAASEYKILHRFKGSPDGANSFAGLIFDAMGNLYGTTSGGGAHVYYGTVFELKPNANGTWTENVLYSFCSIENCADGARPEGRLIFDAVGNLYGTTSGGGASGDHGAVFELKHNVDGSWAENLLYGFAGGTDGAKPSAALIFDPGGNLYGTTNDGGSHGAGTVFELTANADGSWTESVLYSFTGGADGSNPLAGVILDLAGNLYGSTSTGGLYGLGVVFKLMRNTDGIWTESVLHSFTRGADGGEPNGVIFDANGNLYGTTFLGGVHDSGTVFKLAPRSDGTWKETVLHTFSANPGEYPQAGLIFDSAGSLYGTTSNGGHSDCPSGSCGTAFKLTLNSNGSWTYTVPHVFRGKPAMNPVDGLVIDKAGSLYGTTPSCSSTTCGGVVFEITP